MRWRERTSIADNRHTPHRLQTTRNAGQEEIVVYLRMRLRLSLVDWLAVVREFIEPAMSCSELDRLLRRRGVNRLPEPEGTTAQAKSFRAYEPGYAHMDVKCLPQVQDESERRDGSWPSTVPRPGASLLSRARGPWHRPQRALNLNTPIQALKKWQTTHPDLFTKRVVNPPGLGS